MIRFELPLVIIGVFLIGLVAGCITGGPDGTGNLPLTGNLALLVSDDEADIADFDSLIVSFSHARIFVNENGTGFEEFDLNGTSVDLTQVIGEQAISILNVELPQGRYTKVELHVASVNGIVDGNGVMVQIPSNKLQIVRPFTITAGETTTFVFDIHVVKQGSRDQYNLLPVIGKSGVVGDDVPPIVEVNCTVDEDCNGTEICIEGVCLEVECVEDSDCEGNWTCLDNVCVECIEDGDCDGMELCVDNACVEVECIVDGDCLENQTCVDNECVDLECVIDGDCGENETCLNNTCVELECVLDEDCGELQICVDNECIGVECLVDSDCLGNETCINNTCEINETGPPSQCDDANVSAVYSCPDGSLRVVSSVPGAGFTIIRPDDSEIDCPVVAEPSQECQDALDTCYDENLCE